MQKFDVTQAKVPAMLLWCFLQNFIFVNHGQLGIVGIQDGWARKLIRGCTHMPNSCSKQTRRRSAIIGSDST